MKAVSIILKVLAALAAVLGAITVLSIYGDKIVAWCKKVVVVTWDDEDNIDDEDIVDEEIPTEESPVEEVAVDEEAPVADEADFEG